VCFLSASAYLHACAQAAYGAIVGDEVIAALGLPAAPAYVQVARVFNPALDPVPAEQHGKGLPTGYIRARDRVIQGVTARVGRWHQGRDGFSGHVLFLLRCNQSQLLCWSISGSFFTGFLAILTAFLVDPGFDSVLLLCHGSS